MSTILIERLETILKSRNQILPDVAKVIQDLKDAVSILENGATPVVPPVQTPAPAAVVAPEPVPEPAPSEPAPEPTQAEPSPEPQQNPS
jgi:hypothetical protein